MTSPFKRAAVHGINHELIRNGFAKYPSKLAADAAADLVAGKPDGAAAALPEAPPAGPQDMGGGAPPGGHSPQDVMAVAQELMQVAEQLMASAKGGAGAPDAAGGPVPGMPPPEKAEPAAEELGKQAAAADLETVARESAANLLNKIAMEKQALGDKVEISKGSNKNTPEAAAKEEGLAKLDLQQRPVEEYHHGVGKTEMDTTSGMIGKMEKQPVQPKTTVSGTNSVNEDAGKSASFQGFRDALLKQAAVGDKVEIAKGKNKNTADAAAKEEGLAKLDKMQRPANYALVGVGNANFKEPAAARIGMEQPHPEAPKTKATGASTNSVIEASKVSEEQFQAAQVLMFESCAEKVGQALPLNMTSEQKVASINAMIAMTDGGRQNFINRLHTASKTAGELAEMLGMTAGTEESKQEPKTEKAEKKEEAKEEKKEASANPMMVRIQAIADKATARK